MPRFSRYFILAGLLAVALMLAGCGESTPEALADAEPIASGDACHVCGMTIADHPGPKGEAFMGADAQALKFCSTAELFTFLRQPENESQFSHAYVHDMSATDWDSPGGDAFIRTGEAVYVIGHDRRGSMGHTLAPFSDKNAAEAFMKDHGGEIIAFDEITLERLANLGGEAEHSGDQEHGGGDHAHTDHAGSASDGSESDGSESDRPRSTAHSGQEHASPVH